MLQQQRIPSIGEVQWPPRVPSNESTFARVVMSSRYVDTCKNMLKIAPAEKDVTLSACDKLRHPVG